MPKPKMTIAIVTTHPPGTGSLNEYAYHFVRCLRLKSEVSEIILLTDDLPPGQEYQFTQNTGALVRVLPCWKFGALNNPLRILAAVHQVKPDVVLFNLQFATFGKRKIAATLGLLTPALLRRMGYTTVVLLHHLMEKIDLNSAGFGSSIEQLIRFFGTLVTRSLLTTNLVILTIPNYVELLEEKYGADNVLFAPHGAFGEMPSPSFELVPNETQVIMAFGKFGTYKRVEPLVEAFILLQADQRPSLELVIAGTDSPNAPGYLESVKQKYAHIPNISFTGYVPEEQVPNVFGSATLVVFPYTSTTGSSGVLHQAGEYGKAVVLPSVGDFADVVNEEGYIGRFFEPSNVQSLAQTIETLLDNPQECQAIGQHNYLAAHGLPISDVVDWYLVHFQSLLESKMGRTKRRKQHADTRISGEYSYHTGTERTL